jgi:hypothetical protein
VDCTLLQDIDINEVRFRPHDRPVAEMEKLDKSEEEAIEAWQGSNIYRWPKRLIGLQ